MGRPGDAHPHAGIVVEAADVGDPELGEAGDDQPLDRADVVGCADRDRNVDDRVTDELPRPVIRDVAAALDRHEVGPHRCRLDEHVDREVGAQARA